MSWGDVDLKNKIIHIRHSVKYDRENKKYIIGSTKTPKAVRDIPIGDSVIAELKRQKARLAGNKLKLGDAYQNNNLVFSAESGKILNLNCIDAQFRLVIRKSKIEHRTFHDLRHTFASICISKKANIKALSEFLGHSNIGITYDVYGHLMPGDKEDIANTIEKHLAGAGA